MTLSKLSSRLYDKASDRCAQCGGPLRERPLKPYPLFWQILFGISFILFLYFFPRLKDFHLWLWIWSGTQVIIGLLLVRGRILFQRRVLRCVRCGAPLALTR